MLGFPFFREGGEIKAHEWIQKLTELHAIQPEQRSQSKVIFAGVHLGGVAYEWFCKWHDNHKNACWEEFCEVFTIRFGEVERISSVLQARRARKEKEHQRKLEEDKQRVKEEEKRRILLEERRNKEEEKKRILLEEERRKVAARQKLLELEEKIARREALKKKQVAAILIQKYVRRHQAQKYYKRLQSASKIIQAGFRGMTSRNEFRIKKQIKAAIKIQTQWRSYRDSSYYQKLTKATIMIQSTWKGKATREKIKIKRKQQGPKIPTSKDMTKSTPHWKEPKNEIHDPRMPSKHMSVIHVGHQKGRDDKESRGALITMEVKSEIRCINLLFTCWKGIKPLWKYGMLQIPLSPLHQITKGELVVFSNKLCECRMKMQGNMTTFKRKSQSTLLVKQDLNPWIKGAMVQRKRYEDLGVTHNLVEDDNKPKERNQKEIPKYTRQLMARKQGKRTSVAVASKQMILYEVEDLWRHMGTSKQMILHEVEDLWRHMGTRHKWPDLCYEDAAHSSRGDGMI